MYKKKSNQIMRKRVFISLSLLYFFGGLMGTSFVSQSISEYIGRNGWDEFNYYTVITAYIFGGGIVFLLGYSLWKKHPTRIEWIIGISGFTASFYVLTHFVLLTTEFVHIPQFMGLTVLLVLAHPEKWSNALLWSAFACILDEGFQSLIPDRVLDVNDILFNLIGLYLGALVSRMFVFPSSSKRTVDPSIETLQAKR